MDRSFGGPKWQCEACPLGFTPPEKKIRFAHGHPGEGSSWSPMAWKEGILGRSVADVWPKFGGARQWKGPLGVSLEMRFKHGTRRRRKKTGHPCWFGLGFTNPWFLLRDPGTCPPTRLQTTKLRGT